MTEKDDDNETLLEKQIRLVLETQCAEMGRMIGAACPAGVGFAFLMFDFGKNGNIAYVSNADRADMIRSLERLIARWKAE